MRKIILFSLTVGFLLCGCASSNPASDAGVSAVGKERDEHGCIGSAGYRWCEKTQKCERPWELAAKIGFEKSHEEFINYCRQ